MNGINNRSIGSKMTKNISKISLFLLTFLCMQSCREDNPFGGATGTEKDLSSTYKCNFLGADNKQ